MQNKFARFLQEKRTALGLSIRGFATHIYGDDKKFAHLAKLEKGKVQANITTVQFILDKLDSELQIEEF
jgi:predicted transcriptional regulator